ncbi:mechanosensitive ion channel family protein [Neolewinella antarctica]|uniref:Small-conductance mechanosensitive channel n=1 Tax=Neolewinella antarctica TaxID=442734 RepID=A0ABX0XB23_9BACT|nr:mechanosensitive ion channel domain-containing protein [Neolewinella antarctica]NJC26166.1 small-conductance mechanosensitive channel [Neolewinella antarctica]
MNELLPFLQDFPLIVRMAILCGFALLIATAFVLVFRPIVGAAGRRTNSYALQEVAKRTRSSVFWIVASGLTLSFWDGLAPASGATDATVLPAFVRGFQILVRTFLYVFIAVFILKLVNIGADTLRHVYAIDDQNDLRERKILTQLQYIQRIVGIVIFIIFAALILMQFSAMRNLGTALLTSAGVGSIIIGLAAQKSIANLLAGFQIAFTQPIRLDDALIVNGEYGWVEEITLTYVTMRLWDERRQIIPLQKFIDDTFQNWTRSSTQLIGTVLLYVDYTFPVPALREELLRFLPTQPLWDERVHSVAVTDNTDRAMTIRVLVSAKDASDTFALRCATREHCIGWIQENYRNCLPQNRVAPPLTSGKPSADVEKVGGFTDEELD